MSIFKDMFKMVLDTFLGCKEQIWEHLPLQDPAAMCQYVTQAQCQTTQGFATNFPDINPH